MCHLAIWILTMQSDLDIKDKANYFISQQINSTCPIRCLACKEPKSLHLNLHFKDEIEPLTISARKPFLCIIEIETNILKLRAQRALALINLELQFLLGSHLQILTKVQKPPMSLVRFSLHTMPLPHVEIPSHQIPQCIEI